MRRAPRNIGSSAGGVPGSPSRVGCQLRRLGPERTFATRAKVAVAGGYRDVVLDDEEDYADDHLDDRPDGAVVAHADPAPIERFRRTSIGTALAAGLLGLRDVLEPPKDETPAIV